MQSSVPTTSKAAFITDPVFSCPGPTDGTSSFPAACAPETTAKGAGETSFLERLLSRLQDNRLQSGDPETARKLQEINRSQNASNVILKKVLNIAFVTTGVALLLSVIFVIVYTSIVKNNSKDDERGSADKVANGEQSSQLGDYKQPITIDHKDQNVHPQQPSSRDTVVVSLDDVNSGDGRYLSVGEISSSGTGRDGDQNLRGTEEDSSSAGKPPVDRPTITRCRAVPLSNDGEVKMGQMCYQSRGEDGVYSFSET